LCFISLTATGTSDLRSNPIEAVYPMAGLQVSIVNSILNKHFLQEGAILLNTAINLIIFVLALMICMNAPALMAFLLSAGLSAGYFLLAYVFFAFFGLWLDLFFPLLIIGSTYAGCLLYRLLIESRKRHLLEQELEIALTIQKSFLPKDIKSFFSIGVSAFIQPAKFVGGDLYDIVALDDKRLGVLIGDVSGKGVSAALIMAQTISMFRILSLRFNNPGEVLGQLNNELSKVLNGRFVTAQYIIIDLAQRKISGACAGHQALIYYSKQMDDILDFLASSGAALGLFKGAQYSTVSRHFYEGDKLLLYTDGLTEARHKGKEGDEFGIKRLKDIILRSKSLRGEQILGLLEKEIYRFEDKSIQHDDIACVMLDIN
jgi:hypothetical protein